MSRRAPVQTEGPGQDSFLDVTANLVGVLIILVMVVGTQANTAIVSATTTAAVDPADSPDLAEARRAYSDEERRIAELKNSTEREQFEIDFRRAERDRIQLLVAAAQAEIDAARNKLTSQDQERFDLQSELRASEAKLASMQQTILSAVQTETQSEVLKHYPTPMAKTVFGRELHFRLAEGRVTFVPFEEFVERLKQDAPKHVWKLKETEEITESLGPLQGFRMQYTLQRETVQVPVSGGTARGERVALKEFTLVPVSSDLGEPVDAALADNSEFQTTLGQYDPKKFTVTLWVYPDSFGYFRKVRELIMKRGFVAAGRPMPEGHPIGGSPEGSRSAAQ